MLCLEPDLICWSVTASHRLWIILDQHLSSRQFRVIGLFLLRRQVVEHLDRCSFADKINALRDRIDFCRVSDYSRWLVQCSRCHDDELGVLLFCQFVEIDEPRTVYRSTIAVERLATVAQKSENIVFEKCSTQTPVKVLVEGLLPEV